METASLKSVDNPSLPTFRRTHRFHANLRSKCPRRRGHATALAHKRSPPALSGSRASGAGSVAEWRVGGKDRERGVASRLVSATLFRALPAARASSPFFCGPAHCEGDRKPCAASAAILDQPEEDPEGT